MRTTLELPSVLARRAKLAAIRRGLSMKTLVALALEHELGGRSKTMGKNIRFPLIRSREPGTYELNPATISDILVREEEAAYEAADRR